MTSKLRASLCLLSLLIGVEALAVDTSQKASVDYNWPRYWASVGVSPSPPRDFLHFEYTGRVENLTDGKISNETARRWVLADLRRGRGDIYAAQNLRDDIANANIFGPPGLNGTVEGIESRRAQGILRIEASNMPPVIAAAVIAVPRESQLQAPDLGLTDYIVVLLYRTPPTKGTLIYRDGRRQPLESKGVGELHWQLDTGYFYEHPVLGPLWYQQNGWFCKPDAGFVGKICGRLKP